jgi:hypothetical protein
LGKKEIYEKIMVKEKVCSTNYLRLAKGKKIISQPITQCIHMVKVLKSWRFTHSKRKIKTVQSECKIEGREHEVP